MLLFAVYFRQLGSSQLV